MDPPAHPARHDTRGVPVPGAQRWATAVPSANDVLTMPGCYRSSSLSYTIHRSSQLACSALLTGSVPRYKLRRHSAPPPHEQQVPRVTVTVMAQVSYLLAPSPRCSRERTWSSRTIESKFVRPAPTDLPEGARAPLRTTTTSGLARSFDHKVRQVRQHSTVHFSVCGGARARPGLWTLDSGLWTPEEPQRSASVPVHREATGIHCPQCQ